MPATAAPAPPETSALESAIDSLYKVSALLDYMRLHFWDSQQLTVTQLRLLGILLDEEGLSNADLADRLLVTRPSVSALLDRLERGGFIRRETSPVDRRGIRIFLEERGRAAISYARNDSRTFARDLFQGLAPHEVEDIGRAFALLASHGRERRSAALAAHQRLCDEQRSG